MIIYSEKLNLESIGINLENPLNSSANLGLNLFLKLEEKINSNNNDVSSALNNSSVFKKISDTDIRQNLFHLLEDSVSIYIIIYSFCLEKLWER